MDVASALERYMLDLVNAERVAHGLGLLKLELNLNTSADTHSQWIADADTFSHTGAGGSSHTQRIVAADFDLAGAWTTAENIAAVTINGYDSLFDEVDRMHANLMNSPTHRANILREGVDFIGIGLHLGALTFGSGQVRDALIVTQNFAATSRGVTDLDLAGDNGHDVLTGGAGDDHIVGAGGKDTITTGAGDDTVYAGWGGDRIDVGAGQGNKLIDGEAGTDALLLARGRADVALSVQNGQLLIDTGDGVLRLVNMEWVEFSDGAVSVAELIDTTLHPPQPAPQPEPEPAPDPAPDPEPTLSVRHGSSTGDRLDGSDGQDLITGGGGADTLSGGEGRDVLVAEERGLYGSDASAQVYRLFSAVFDREPGRDGHQQFTTDLASGTTSLEALAEALVQSAEFQTLYGDTPDAAFITLMFHNILDRAPSDAGLAAWNSYLTGHSRAELVVSLSESSEHRLNTSDGLAAFEGRENPAAWSDEVFRLYDTLFGRPPAQDAVAQWTGTLAGGGGLDALVESFTGSAEFALRYGGTDDAGFITRLFENVLDRAPGQAGLTAWVAALENGMSRADAVRAFMDTPEYLIASAPALRDFMRGLGTDDVLEAGAGDSVLSGGIYADSFVFAPEHDGTHEITDLEAWDVLDLTGFGYGSVDEALANFTQADDGVVFADQGVTVMLNGWEMTDISEDMLLVG